MKSDTMHLAILPRMAVRYYEPPTPAYWDLSTLRFRWYWRGMHWLLKKLGGAYRDSLPGGVTAQYREINQSDIVAMISDSKRALQYLWGKKAATLLVGYDEMAKLMRDAPTEMLMFDMQMPLANGGKYRVMGLRVVCVPWLEGWAILPWAILPDLNDE